MWRESQLYLVLLVTICGGLLGLGFYTFNYAAGLSYMSDDPAACRNCHVMNDQYDSWRKSSHHAVATCNDCHVPNSLFDKYLAKAINGYHHSKGFTLQDFHEPIMIKEGNAKILQNNCLRCHQQFVHDILPGSTSADDTVQCVHCHRDVAHLSK